MSDGERERERKILRVEPSENRGCLVSLFLAVYGVGCFNPHVSSDAPPNRNDSRYSSALSQRLEEVRWSP